MTGIGIVAVHCGAGARSSKYRENQKLCMDVCRAGVELLRNGKNALEVVRDVIALLEDDEKTNAGFGSNLTERGCVEADASIMDGRTLLYGGCGAVKSVKNPIHLAYDLCKKQDTPREFGLIPPSFLVGTGATLHASVAGLQLVKEDALITKSKNRSYRKFKRRIELVRAEDSDVGPSCKKIAFNRVVVKVLDGGSGIQNCETKTGMTNSFGRCERNSDSFTNGQEVSNSRDGCESRRKDNIMRSQISKEESEGQDVANSTLDTVGAVCIDTYGHVASGCSSGGLFFKKSGRVGQAALYASGVWADSFSEEEPSIGVCTTGCGEYLIRTQLAKQIADDLKDVPAPAQTLRNTMTDKFLSWYHCVYSISPRSLNIKFALLIRHLRNVHSHLQKLGGALVLHMSKTGDVSVIWGHTSDEMIVGYMSTGDEQPKSTASRLPENVEAGTSTMVGESCYFNCKG